MAVTAYHIGVDDQLQISVWQNPDLSVTVPVRPDGMITVPLIGDVQVGGQTPEAVAATIQAKLKSFVRDPQVAVILTELRSHEYLSRVRVTGAVRTPISLPYRQGMTIPPHNLREIGAAVQWCLDHPEAEEAALLPCLITGTPAAAATATPNPTQCSWTRS